MNNLAPTLGLTCYRPTAQKGLFHSILATTATRSCVPHIPLPTAAVEWVTSRRSMAPIPASRLRRIERKAGTTSCSTTRAPPLLSQAARLGAPPFQEALYLNSGLITDQINHV